jgi:hypothetical protein
MTEDDVTGSIDDRPEVDLPEGGSAARSFVAEAVRKAVLTGVGALFLTEEGARKLAREWKLPKELAGYVVAQAQGAKDEVLRLVAQEVRRFLESEAFRREVKDLIGSMSVEVKAEIRFKDSQKDAPKGRGSSKVQRSRHTGGPEGEPAE